MGTKDTIAQTWHYQPVYVDDPEARTISLCEVYTDDDGKLVFWSMTRNIAAQGETIAELSRDLATMIVDANRWKPVAFSDLCVGMQLHKILAG